MLLPAAGGASLVPVARLVHYCRVLVGCILMELVIGPLCWPLLAREGRTTPTPRRAALLGLALLHKLRPGMPRE